MRIFGHSRDRGVNGIDSNGEQYVYTVLSALAQLLAVLTVSRYARSSATAEIARDANVESHSVI